MSFDAVDWFNLWEALFWAGLGVAATGHSFRNSVEHRSGLRRLAGLLILFAVSDLIELRTGAWWKPWWLAAWKVLCVVGISWQALQSHRLGAFALHKAAEDHSHD